MPPPFCLFRLVTGGGVFHAKAGDLRGQLLPGPRTGSGASMSLAMSLIFRCRREPPGGGDLPNCPPRSEGGTFFRATINCGLKSPIALRKVDSEGTETVSMRDLMAVFVHTRPSSPFGLRPHCDEGRVLHFRLESAN